MGRHQYRSSRVNARFRFIGLCSLLLSAAPSLFAGGCPWNYLRRRIVYQEDET
jgi:hypothetical protein